MKVEIITPEKQLYKGEADLIQMPGSDGLFEVLKNHAPMIAALGKGRIKLQDSNQQQMFFDINGGVAEISENKVRILAD